MEEVVVFMNCLNIGALTRLSEQAGDNLWKTTSTSNLVLANGQFEPEFPVTAGKWYRFRFVFAAIEQLLRLSPVSTDGGSCVLQLVAKDGVYLATYPRLVNRIDFGPGNRADVAIKCDCTDAAACNVAFVSIQDGDVHGGTAFTLTVSLFLSLVSE